MASFDVAAAELHRLGDREKGRRFERLCVWLLESKPAFGIRRAYAWDAWRERRLTRDRREVGTDVGIDIVAETETGELWAVQAKCYRETSTASHVSPG